MPFQGMEPAPPDRCLNCGTPRGETPMMRPGPGGAQTLCNACGLLWRNKGRLRDVASLKSCGRGAKVCCVWESGCWRAGVCLRP